jgi:HEXXH motif-containing protein
MTMAVEFCSPRAKPSPRAFDPIPQAFAKAVVRRVSRETAKDVALKFPDFDARQGRNFAAAWAPELGTGCLALREKNGERGAVQTLLAMVAQGCSGSWDIELRDPHQVSFAGYCLNVSGHLRCEHHDGNLHLSLGTNNGGQDAVFHFTDLGWRVDDDRASPGALFLRRPTFLTAAGFEDCYVLACEQLQDDASDDIMVWPPLPPRDGADGLQAAAAESTSKALELISGLGEHYRDWLKPMLRGIVASRRRDTTTGRSGSCPDQPGVIHVAFPTVSEEELGETLIHEVSHQYFFLLGYVAPLVDPADETLYYSSFKGRMRNIDRILLALHATANMTVYWSDLIHQQGRTPRRTAALRNALEHTSKLGAVVDDSEGVTAAGQQLWKIQKALIAERGLTLDGL